MERLILALFEISTKKEVEKMIKKLILMFLIATLVLSVAYANNNDEPNSSSSGAGGGQSQAIEPEMPVACTMDAKICPDGSAVGRIGPNCKFAPCPNADDPNTGVWHETGCYEDGNVVVCPAIPPENYEPDYPGEYRYVKYLCSGEEDARKMGGETSCKPYSLWSTYAADDCCPDENGCVLQDIQVYERCDEIVKPKPPVMYDDKGNLQQRIEKLEARVQRLENALFKIKQLIPNLDIEAVDWKVIQPVESVPSEVIPTELTDDASWSTESSTTSEKPKKMKYRVITQNEVEAENVKVKAPKDKKFTIVNDVIYINKDNKQYEVPREFVIGDANKVITVKVETEDGTLVATKTIVTEKPSWFFGLWKDLVETEVGKIKLPEAPAGLPIPIPKPAEETN